MNFQIFSLLAFVFVGITLPFEFDIQEQKAGLSFVKQSQARISYDTYTMLYHLDISEYKNLIKLVENFLKYGSPLSESLKSTTAKILINQIKNHLNHMRRDEMDIEAYQQKTRNKRSIEVVGSFLHWAFGLMDADTARDYDTKINDIQNTSARFHNILKEQTILIKEVINLNNKTLSDFQYQINKLKRYVNEYVVSIYSHFNFVKAEIIFTEGVTLSKFIMMEHQRYSQQILRCLEDVVSGKITQLIPKEKLISDLIEIESHLRENQKLPIDFNVENPLHIFKYSKISASLYGNRLLLEVTIPIVERETYTVYKIIPIPATINNNTVIINPSTHYVLLNNEQKEYIPITSKEYSKSKFNMRGERIVKPAENARIEYSQNCEISIFMNPIRDTIQKFCDIKRIPTSNYFISINSNDMFYVKIVKPVLITEFCRNKVAQNRVINESGFLKLDKECRVTTDKISLRPRAAYRFESRDIIVLANSTQNMTFDVIMSKVKFLNNISIPHIEDNVLIQDYSNDFNILYDKAEKLIEKSKMESKYEEIHYDNINRTRLSFLFTGILVLIIVTVISFVLWYLYKKFFNINTWIKLADVLGKNSNNVPKIFVRNVDSTAMLDRNRSRSSLVHVEDSSA